MVVVSGGGWGVGDVEGAVRELCRVPEVSRASSASPATTSSCATRLSATFAGEPRVHVYGFTDEMPQLLAAADALVHSTGGVTCLEAKATGTPVVSYGLPVGHARLNTRAMADLELLRLANDTGELREHVQASFAEGRAVGSARRHAGARARVPARRASTRSRRHRARGAPPRAARSPLWRLRLAAFCVQLLLLLGVGTWTMSTDEVAALAADDPERALARAGAHRPARRRLDRARARATRSRAWRAPWPRRASTPRSPTAGSTRPPRSLALRALGDELLPEVPPGTSVLRWVRTRGALRAQARALGLHHRFYFLEPRGGLTGRLSWLLGREPPARPPCSGRCGSTPPGRCLSGRTRAGDVLVVGVDGSGASVLWLERLVSWLGADGLSAEPLAALTRSPEGRPGRPASRWSGRPAPVSAAPVLAAGFGLRARPLHFHQREQQRRAGQHHGAHDQHQPATPPAAPRPAGFR